MCENSVFYYVDGDPLNGMWIDLDDINTFDEVIEQLADGGFISRDQQGLVNYDGEVLVADTDGELANLYYQKYGGFDLDGFIEARDSGIDLDVVAAFIMLFSCWDKNRCEENYLGRFDSPEDYARSFCDETGILDSIPENLRYYFDFERYARDLMISDVCSDGDHYFYNW